MKATLECWCGIRVEVTLDGEHLQGIIHVTTSKGAEHSIEVYQDSGINPQEAKK